MADGRKRSDLRPGLKVQIVLKQDQRSGKLTSGVVQEILTPSANHPHGIKVRLSDGQVGRVKQIILGLLLPGLLLLGLGGLSATSASSAPRQYSDLRQVTFKQRKANQTIKSYSKLQPSDEDKINSDICPDLAKRTDGYRQLNVAILDEIMRSPREIEADDGKVMTAQQAWVLKRHPLFYPVQSAKSP